MSETCLGETKKPDIKRPFADPTPMRYRTVRYVGARVHLSYVLDDDDGNYRGGGDDDENEIGGY